MYSLSLKRPHFEVSFENLVFENPGHLFGKISINTSGESVSFKGSLSPNDITDLDLDKDSIEIPGWGWNFKIMQQSDGNGSCSFEYDSSKNPEIMMNENSPVFKFSLDHVSLSKDAIEEFLEELKYFQIWVNENV